MSVGTLEEIIDDTHAIVSTSVGSEHYVSILSFVDKDQVKFIIKNIYIFFLSQFIDIDVFSWNLDAQYCLTIKFMPLLVY